MFFVVYSWNPPLPSLSPRKMWGTILLGLGGTLNFCLTLGRAKPNRVFKIFHTLGGGGGTKGFLYWGNGRVPPPLAKNSLIPSPLGKVPPSRLPLPKVHFPHSNKQFHVITQ